MNIGQLTYNTSINTAIEKVAQAERLDAMPSSGVIIPSYSSINQIMMAPQQDGRIQFMDALSKLGAQYVKKRIADNQALEYQKAAINLTQTLKNASDQFLNNTQDGNGYTEFITETHKNLLNSAIQNASTSDVKKQIQAWGHQSAADWANRAFQKQNELQTAYVIRQNESNVQTLINQVRANPKNYNSLKKLLTDTINQATSSIPDPRKRIAIAGDTMSSFMYSYGLGMCDEDPYMAQVQLLGTEFTSGMKPGQYQALMNYCTGQISARKRQQEKEQKFFANAKAQQRMDQVTNLMIKIALGEVTPEQVLATEYLTPKERLKLIEKSQAQQKKVTDFLKNNAIINDRIQNNQSLLGIPDKHQEKWFDDFVVAQKNKLAAENQKLQLSKLAEVAKNCTAPLKKLTTEIKHQMLSGDTESMLDAAVAYDTLSKESPNTLVHLDDQKIINACLTLAREIGYGNNIYKVAETITQDLTKLDKTNTESRNKILYGADAIKKVADRLETDTEAGWFETGNPPHLNTPKSSPFFIREARAALYGAIIGGAKTTESATNLAADRLDKMFPKTDINGFTERMWNPPEKLLGSNMPKMVIKQKIGTLIDAAVSSAIKGGDPILAGSANIVNGRLNPKNIGKFSIDIKDGNKKKSCTAFIRAIPGEKGKYNIVYTDGDSDFFICNPNSNSLFDPVVISVDQLAQ